MASSIRPGLTCMCFIMLLFLHAQGENKCDNQGMKRVNPDCCINVSTRPINEPIKYCFEQKEDSYKNCPVHAYRFVGESGREYCVDPNSDWLSKRLDKLKKVSL
ncbi:hypothetical protein PAMP_010655 [Pampus punctatissimus]